MDETKDPFSAVRPARDAGGLTRQPRLCLRLRGDDPRRQDRHRRRPGDLRRALGRPYGTDRHALHRRRERAAGRLDHAGAGTCHGGARRRRHVRRTARADPARAQDPLLLLAAQRRLALLPGHRRRRGRPGAGRRTARRGRRPRAARRLRRGPADRHRPRRPQELAGEQRLQAPRPPRHRGQAVRRPALGVRGDTPRPARRRKGQGAPRRPGPAEDPLRQRPAGLPDAALPHGQDTAVTRPVRTGRPPHGARHHHRRLRTRGDLRGHHRAEGRPARRAHRRKAGVPHGDRPAVPGSRPHRRRPRTARDTEGHPLPPGRLPLRAAHGGGRHPGLAPDGLGGRRGPRLHRLRPDPPPSSS